MYKRGGSAGRQLCREVRRPRLTALDVLLSMAVFPPLSGDRPEPATDRQTDNSRPAPAPPLRLCAFVSGPAVEGRAALSGVGVGGAVAGQPETAVGVPLRRLALLDVLSCAVFLRLCIQG